jgi:hypothetical protein
MSTTSTASGRDTTATAARGQRFRASRRIGGLLIAAVVVGIGVASIVQGLGGRATVRDSLRLEGVVGAPYMTPERMAVIARKAGLRDVALPTCSVAGKPVDGGGAARCFAQYMRIDALVVTKGRTYAQVPPFATADGRGTINPERAVRGPDGEPYEHPAHATWVTQAALSTALNTSYMAEQVSLFGVAVGAGFLLLGLALAGVAVGGPRMPLRGRMRQRAA